MSYLFRKRYNAKLLTACACVLFVSLGGQAATAEDASASLDSAVSLATQLPTTEVDADLSPLAVAPKSAYVGQMAQKVTTVLTTDHVNGEPVPLGTPATAVIQIDNQQKLAPQ